MNEQRPCRTIARRHARLPLLGILATATAATGCMTLDPFFFTNEASDGYGWDDDPCDPQLQGEIVEVEHAKLGGETPSCHPSRVPADARTEGVVNVDGRSVHYVFAQRQDAVATIFYSHGRSKHLGRYWDRVERMWNLGYSVMIYDYPGHGRSDGEPDEAGMYANAQAVLELLPSMPGVDPTAVYFVGYSLGGAPTYELARRASTGETDILPRGIVSESAFCSTATLVQDGAYIDMPAQFVANNRFDNCAAIAELDQTIRLLVMHGAQDTFLLPVHADKLVVAAEGRAELYIIENADHEELPALGGAMYDSQLRDFMVGR